MFEIMASRAVFGFPRFSALAVFPVVSTTSLFRLSAERNNRSSSQLKPSDNPLASEYLVSEITNEAVMGIPEENPWR